MTTTKPATDPAVEAAETIIDQERCLEYVLSARDKAEIIRQAYASILEAATAMAEYIALQWEHDPENEPTFMADVRRIMPQETGPKS